MNLCFHFGTSGLTGHCRLYPVDRPERLRARHVAPFEAHWSGTSECYRYAQWLRCALMIETQVTNLSDDAVFALAERKSLERIHLSYCDRISVQAVHFLLQGLHHLTHLSLTGVPAFRQPELQTFCRPPPRVSTGSSPVPVIHADQSTPSGVQFAPATDILCLFWRRRCRSTALLD